MSPALVIFDCDGVLVDSETPANELLVANLARHGMNISIAFAEQNFVGGTLQKDFETLKAMGADLPDDWCKTFRKELHHRLQQGVEPISGIVAVLDLLDERGVPYCVASNGSDEKMAITLGHTGLWDRFVGRRFSAKTIGIFKPEPGLYLAAAREMGVSADQCVVVEDSASGALAAKRAGMPCLGYAPKGGGEALAQHGARIFGAMDDLPGLLGLV
ncbi:HAD-IA family hydrolase [uncultured Cohaesibacter sp.]|uniref:HAD family hydrolase n=1 Tax=uncultured Cohaesibacter sp. TaxID=1002546 RepID=UPI0029C98FF2|nr:HAD-IA family hydrolase [uncultured Cohaesibacter sp.]